MARGRKRLVEVNDLDVLLQKWKNKTFKYLDVEDILETYEEIIDLAKDGYDETVITPKGEPVVIRKRDLPTALKALSAHRELVNELINQGENNGVTVAINVLRSPQPQATAMR